MFGTLVVQTFVGRARVVLTLSAGGDGGFSALASTWTIFCPALGGPLPITNPHKLGEIPKALPLAVSKCRFLGPSLPKISFRNSLLTKDIVLAM